MKFNTVTITAILYKSTAIVISAILVKLIAHQFDLEIIALNNLMASIIAANVYPWLSPLRCDI
jgi:hypothetical protein